MKHYLVDLEWTMPYPKKVEYKISSSNIGLAIYRATKQLRKNFKGLRLTKLTARATYYGKSGENTPLQAGDV